MSVVGRKQELKILEKILTSDEAELLAVYGRRRVGKTFLISRFFRDKGIYFELTGVSKGSMREQLGRFVTAFVELFHIKGKLPSVKNWFDAFDLLRQEIEKIPKNKKIILFFDELPWLATKRPKNLLSAFEHTWNRYFSRMPNVKMIVCGSAASWMIKKVISNRGGFYGRLTHTMHLLPLSLNETEQYLINKRIQLDRRQIIEVYLAIGGIPKYLNQIEPGRSSAQIIYDLCFSHHAYLKTEFKRLFASLFDKFEKHVSIVRALAKKHQGFTVAEIAKLTQIPSGGTLSTLLEELELSGFIRFEPYYGKKKREGLYRLVDEYSLFYLTWIEPQEEQSYHYDYWLNLHRSAKYISWAGYAFENLCIKYAHYIIEALKIGVVAERCSYWSYHSKGNDDYPGAQIDMLIDRRDRCIHLCEIKFSENEYVMTKDRAESLERKRFVFRSVTQTNKSIFNTLITPFGARKNSAYLSTVDHQLDMNMLFNS